MRRAIPRPAASHLNSGQSGKIDAIQTAGANGMPAGFLMQLRLPRLKKPPSISEITGMRGAFPTIL